LVSLSVDSIPDFGLLSAPMGALHATNSHNPPYSDLLYQLCCQLNSSSGESRRTIHVLRGSTKG